MIDRFKRGIKQPFRIARKLNRLYHHNLRRTQNKTDVIEADWDNLLILDACRYDAFVDVWGNEAKKIRSPAASTPEFIRKVLSGKELYDTVYITANPQVYKRRQEESISIRFFSEHNIWRESGWDEQYQTVRPEKLIEESLDIIGEFQNKRIIIHFMQPHTPYIGERGEKIKNLTGESGLGFLDHVKQGDINISDELLWEGYMESLEIVIKQIKQLLPRLQGKTAITADHGELLGERVWPIPVKEYGHFSGFYHPKLIDVPWYVTQNGQRKKIEEDKPKPIDTVSADVEDRLAAFGYK